jgi:hypothetical protein
MRPSKYLLILLICSIGFSQKYDLKTGELINQEKYDPVTGEPIKATQYDPVTGEPIKATQYDPVTGEPIDDTSKPGPMFNNALPSTPLINLGDNVTLTTITGVIFKGTLILQDEEKIVLSSPSIGEIKVSRENIKRLTTANESDLNKITNSNRFETINDKNVSSSPSYLSIIKAAKAQAKLKNKSQVGVNVGVGGLGCLFSAIGVPLASLYALSSTSKAPNTNYYNNLSNENKTIYRSTYKSEVNRLKRNTIFGTMGAIMALFFFTIMTY